MSRTSLTPEDIAGADVIVLANDVAVRGAERFAGRKGATVKVSPHHVIQNAQGLYRALVRRGHLTGGERNE